MRYLPKSPADRAAMLQDIGAASIDDLFDSVPAEYRLTRDLDIPRQHSEHEVMEAFKVFASQNATGYASFLGAGAYRHYRPVLIDSLSQRGEFLTSYTPYQPEIAQGTLQALFEFQTMICELTGMDIANASMYDGSTGAAEAVMMAVRVTGRNGAVIARTVHPEYREVLSTYAQHQGIPQTEVGYTSNGRVDYAALDAAITADTACVLIQSPNFFGTIEDVAKIAEIAHAKGALLIVSIAEAVSLGVVKPPVEADIVSLEAQSFGVAVGFGGPYCGVIAAKEKFLRQMPGRLCGQTVDTDGQRGFVLTLSTREQHIRREKATSNICTNQSLVALMVTIFLTVYGKGLRELAEQNMAKAHFTAESLKKSAGAKLLFEGAPRFNEFVVTTPLTAAETNNELLEQKIIGGLPLAHWYPELGEHAALWCATELTTRAQIDAAAGALANTAVDNGVLTPA
ncbi:glycine cleavage system protein P [Terriglobus roseus DSM 18391]|uniref:Probable glycine dehydrogenase (decarboxylating) subunit 1 n=1 Tax=Terriglobus roseus (strain DSM 18391 / NRRL B-41598 / KBS 63) TaxID=926566 RepID=I3ZKV1_TERRK|nr:aminomethyl-transferring glycine dehydrogenase subunit GcvPA [Terriglobus roseus]AFL89869.1 glycine cleavage system protein P [Terriglobus roseus DSM 18391]